MKGIKAHLILSKDIDIRNGFVSLKGFTQKLSSNVRETVWMYLNIDTILEFPNETPIYFAIFVKETGLPDYIELGNTVLYKSMDTPNVKTITKYKYSTNIIQKFQFPLLKRGEYAFVTYIMDDSTSERTILFTYDFDVL